MHCLNSAGTTSHYFLERRNVVLALLADTGVFQIAKMLPPGAINELKIHQNATAARASTRTHSET